MKLRIFMGMLGAIATIGLAQTDPDPTADLEALDALGTLDVVEEVPGSTEVSGTPESIPEEKPSPPVEVSEILPPASQPATSAASAQTLENVEFRNFTDYSEIQFTVSGKVDVSKVERPQDNQIVVVLPAGSVHPRARRIIPTNEFSSSIATISPFQDPTGQEPTKVVITLRSSAGSRLQVTPQGAILLVENKPGGLPAESAAASGNSTETPGVVTDNPLTNIAKVSSDQPQMGSGGNYVGSRLTIDVRETDVADVLRLLAEVSGFSFVFGDDVQGKITLSLRNVPWDQVLEIVLETFKLSSVRYDNVLRITSIQNLTAQREAEERLKTIEDQAEKVMVKTFQLSFADPQEIQQSVKEFLTPNRGKVSFDKRTNVLAVADVSAQVEKITRLVQSLDVPLPQVQIEAKIVQVKDSFVRNLGINWASGQLFSGGSLPKNSIQSRFSAVNASQVFSFGGQFGSAGALAGVTAQLQLGESQGVARIVSNPRVVTLDRKEAKIVQGQSIPYLVGFNGLEFVKGAQSGDQNVGYGNVKFVEAALNLTVVPQVTADGQVVMKVNLVKDTPADASPVPVIDKRSSQTEVMIRSGETLVLGGVYDNFDMETNQGLPVLRKVPLLGWLFGGKSNQRERSELMIFLTPTIMNSSTL